MYHPLQLSFLSSLPSSFPNFFPFFSFLPTWCHLHTPSYMYFFPFPHLHFFLIFTNFLCLFFPRYMCVLIFFHFLFSSLSPLLFSFCCSSRETHAYNHLPLGYVYRLTSLSLLCFSYFPCLIVRVSSYSCGFPFLYTSSLSSRIWCIWWAPCTRFVSFSWEIIQALW